VELTAEQVKGKVHLLFPGLFNECRLYVNGTEVAFRKQGNLWWLNDYAFEWDVDLSGKLRAGKNTLALRANCEGGEAECGSHDDGVAFFVGSGFPKRRFHDGVRDR
jgi:hypothetical protein